MLKIWKFSYCDPFRVIIESVRVLLMYAKYYSYVLSPRGRCFPSDWTTDISIQLQIQKRYVRKYISLGKTPEIGIPPSDSATKRYTKLHLDFCLRFSTLIGQIGRVPLFGAGPRRYMRSRLFRLAVTVFWCARTASWRQKGKRKQVFPWAIRTTELPSNPSPLTFRNNQIQILQTSSTHATMAANVS